MKVVSADEVMAYASADARLKTFDEGKVIMGMAVFPPGARVPRKEPVFMMPMNIHLF